VKIVVMGAGLAGVTTAWYLAKEGHQVVVIDREPDVAGGASGAATGIIAASRAYPWSAGELGSMLRLDPELWLWSMQHIFLRTGGSFRRVLDAKVRLVRYSQQVMQELARETGFALSAGVLYLYREAQALDAAWEHSQRMRELGFALERLDAAKVALVEPSMDVSRIAGALYGAGDQSGDAGLFCRRLSERLRPLGVEFQLGNEILSIEPADTRVRELLTARGPVLADAFVCALGVMDRRLREQLGTHVPVYPVKGYSATVPFSRAQGGPRHAVIDESRRVAIAPLGGELRITGGAEFSGYRKDHQPPDFAPLYDTAKQLFPGALDYANARVRACQRPMTPETTPRFGTGRYQNLWFNIGLGHMGFAMAAGAARITADQVCGRNPAIDLEGLRIRRH
jgi:D-amino-acid dehydrogenase